MAALLIIFTSIGIWAMDGLASTPKDSSQPATRTKVVNPVKVVPKVFDKHQYSLTDPTSPWVIVNKQNPINPQDYSPPDLISVGAGQRMRTPAANALQLMISAASKAGYVITPTSAYRSYSQQVQAYGSIAKSYGQDYADTVSARPGYSEHQTGWAVDIGTTGCSLDNCFATTPAGQWAANNAYTYGFLLRYPDNLTSITGYSHESWHYRYVGTALSQEMHEKGVATLEQFFEVNGGVTYIN